MMASRSCAAGSKAAGPCVRPLAGAAREQGKAGHSDGHRAPNTTCECQLDEVAVESRASADWPVPSRSSDEMTKLGRRAAEHGRTVDLEVSAVVDEAVRGPLGHYPAVLEVIGQRGLRRTGR